jgi:hypothetical protein
MTTRAGTRGRRRRSKALLAFAALVVASCGGTATGPDQTPNLVPFVGSWRATSLVVTSKANPSVHPDLVQEGAQFDLDVQPSGQYTAILTYSGQASTEIGTASVSGNIVTLVRTFPAPPQTTTATYTLQRDLLTLEGDTEFDFNLDGTPEEARSRTVLLRR